ncbi:LacI family DNA-binding transcriptional regulator [Kribbella sp. NBC_00359]
MARVTIKEIARRCGVSQGAVSYALNNQPGVSAATRARVLRVAAELEWVPNRAARQLSAARSETFGLGWPDRRSSAMCGSGTRGSQWPAGGSTWTAGSGTRTSPPPKAPPRPANY